MSLPMRMILPLLAAPLLLCGCLARTAVDIVTLPVRAASAGVDAVTTSQSERDEQRGRELRRQEEREGRAARQRERDARRQAEDDAANGNGAEPNFSGR
jgi:uncharacterized lipoprotein YajG